MPGRAPLTDDLLRRVAVAYLEETAPGKDRAAVTRVAARFDRPVKTINNWIARARNEGWLGPAAQGRAGADPGPRLLEAKS
jgi:transposase